MHSSVFTAIARAADDRLYADVLACVEEPWQPGHGTYPTVRIVAFSQRATGRSFSIHRAIVKPPADADGWRDQLHALDHKLEWEVEFDDGVYRLDHPESVARMVLALPMEGLLDNVVRLHRGCCNCESTYCEHHNEFPGAGHHSEYVPCPNAPDGTVQMDAVGVVCGSCATQTIRVGGDEYISETTPPLRSGDDPTGGNLSQADLPDHP